MPILSTRGAASYRGFVTQSYGVTATYLIVGGGGSGGVNSTGGGGAGGLLTGTTNLAAGTIYTITVGGGGASTSSPSQGSGIGGINGTDSSILGGTLGVTLSARGGGAAGLYNNTASNGGSGGGGGGGVGVGGLGIAGQGNNGGTGPGGGGGAGAAGTNFAGSWPSSGTSGSGGIGATTTLITTTQATSYSVGQVSGGSVYFAGGGGGAGDSRGVAGGSGGLGGGGGGSASSGVNGSNGSTNTGGGGGGASYGSPQGNSGAGGSGVVIISLPSGFAATTTGTPTVTINGTNTVYTFTGSGTFTPVVGFNATVLLVAGGAGGGYWNGGGGGAGGVVYNTNTNLSSGVAYTVTIGSGGTAGTSTTIGGTGVNTLFNGITALGGGGGGGYTGSTVLQPSNGGSGGGQAGNSGGIVSGGSATQPSSASGGYGNNGGNNGITVGPYPGGGGGGAGAVGGNGSSGGGGNGGIGITNILTNYAQAGQLSSSNYYVGGGGGAGSQTGSSTGGIGGGGAGSSTTTGTNGTTNTGGGGGGGAWNSGGYNGGTGGSGVALISSPYVAAVSSLTGSPTIIALQSYTNYSGSFNGSNQYLNLTGQNLSTGNFTIEAWVYLTATGTSGHIFNFGTDTNNRYLVFINPTTNKFNIGTVNGGTYTLNDSTVTPSVSTWYHVAYVRNSGTSYLYVNGNQVGSNSTPINSGTNWAIGSMQFYTTGNCWSGYISNFRVTNTVVYTSAFTPSTVPLTAITGTQLLTLQNATITDTSTNAYTITNNGSVTTSSTVQPFVQAPITNYVYKFTSSGSLTYTNNTFLNYAASFNGSNQYLTAGAASNWTFLSNGSTYTVECWFNVPSTSTSNVYTLIATAASSANIGIVIGLNNNTAGDVTVQIDRGVGGTYAFWIQDTVGNRFTANTWNHLAVVYNSSTSTCTVYMNGVSILSATGSSFNSSAPTYTLAIGRYQYATPGGYLNGYISNLRITNTVVYTSNFTPSTTHLTAVSGTQLLACQNAALVDNSLNNFAIINNNTVTTTYTTVPFNY